MLRISYVIGQYAGVAFNVIYPLLYDKETVKKERNIT